MRINYILKIISLLATFFYSDLDQVEPVLMTVDTYITWIFTDHVTTNINENII